MTDPTRDEAVEPAPRPRVSIDAEAWALIDQTLAELPYRVAAPMAMRIQQTGGVQPIVIEASP